MDFFKFRTTAYFTRWALVHEFAARAVFIIGYNHIFKQELDITQISFERLDDHPSEGFSFKPSIRFETLKRIPPEMASQAMKLPLARYATVFIQARGCYSIRTFFEQYCWPNVKEVAKTWGFFPEAGLEAGNGNVEIPEAVFELFLEMIDDVMRHWPLITELANQLINNPVIEGQELEDLIESISRKFDQYEHSDDSGWISHLCFYKSAGKTSRL